MTEPLLWWTLQFNFYTRKPEVERSMEANKEKKLKNEEWPMAKG